ncbi:MAG: hypothetical protein AAF632_28120 [Bacteroidota bacterium]
MQYTNLLSQWPIYVLLAAVVTLSSSTVYGQIIPDTTIVSETVADPGKFAIGNEFPQPAELIDPASIPDDAPASPVDSVPDSLTAQPQKKPVLQTVVEKGDEVVDKVGEISDSEVLNTVGRFLPKNSLFNKLLKQGKNIRNTKNQKVKPKLEDIGLFQPRPEQP